jgi:hypothetical protein
MSTEEQTDEQGRSSDAGAPPASDIMAAARTLYPDTAEPQVRLAALMAALDAHGQELIVNVLEAYSAWDHYVKHHPSRTSASPPLTIPGMQTPGFCWVVLICLKNFRLWSVKRHVWGRCGLLYDARTCPAGAIMTTSTESHTAITC